MRIRERDCLYLLFEELAIEGLRLDPWDADARTAWLLKVRDVLAAVPDEAQRMAWAYQLAVALTSRLPGVPLDLMLGWLRQEAP